MSTTNTIGPKPPQRDENGHWLHPDLPWNDLPEETDPTPWFASLGFESAFVSMEEDGSQEVQDRYAEGSPDISDWTPSRPAGEGWFLVAIYDTEDGPYAVFLRPAQAGEGSV